MSLECSESDRCEAVTQLWHKYHGQVYGYLTKLGVPAETADEIVVDAFLTVDRVWPVIRSYDRPEAFVYKVATNQGRWRYRKEAAWRSELVPDGDDVGPSIDDSSSQAITRADVWTAVRQLPRRCREVVVLRYFEGFTIIETAEILGIGEGTAKSYAAEGRAKLASLLQSYDPGQGSR